MAGNLGSVHLRSTTVQDACFITDVTKPWLVAAAEAGSALTVRRGSGASQQLARQRPETAPAACVQLILHGHYASQARGAETRTRNL